MTVPIVFEALTQLLSTLFANPILGMLAFLMFWSSSIIFCGLVFRGNDVIWPFRTFTTRCRSAGF